MERIMIIGCGGAGKSTLARQLGEKTGLPVVHLDKLFWKPGWVSLSQEEFDERHRAAIARQSWIMDGNFDRTIPERLERCDTVLYLDFSRFACLLGVAKRIITSYGQVRPDMGDGCPERFDWEFLQWVWNFNRNKQEKNYRLLAQCADKEIHIFKNRRQVRKFLESL
ncbi:MAG: DNA topology modulation protein [Oscillospiraceae bacterium]|nr:DNA topology modulation protein [Oscillospiraceae bacterium]